MIQIFANGKELVLYKDTTINLEFNNALFSQDTIDGDIAYGFDIPVRGNEVALLFGHLPQSAVNRMFDCVVFVSEMQIVSGKLIIQQASTESLTVSIISTPYPEGWRDRSIRENDSDEIVVSQSLAAHQVSWKEFLKSTLTDDRIKFGPVVNEEGYGDKNDDFGLFEGRNHGKICNRVVFNNTGNIIAINRDPFVRLFNSSVPMNDEDDGNYIERNQQCLLPQIRFSHILSNIVKNMGYSYIDRISKDEDLNPIHIQSLSPLDATGVQYEDTDRWYYLYAERKDRGYYKVPELSYRTNNPQGLMWGVPSASETKWHGVKMRASGWYHIHAVIEPDITPTGEVHFMVAKWTQDGISNSIPPNEPDNITVDTVIGEYRNKKESLVYDDTVYIDSSYTGIPLAFGFWISTSYYGNEEMVWMNQGYSSITVESKSIDQISNNNIYRSRFHIAECFPDVSNGEFLKSAVQSLGLALYINNSSKTAEIVPFRDLLSSESIELTDYVLDRETELEYPDEKKYIFRLTSLEDKDFDESNVIDAVNEISELPSPFENIGKLCYVLSHNSYFKAEKTENDANWRMNWVDQHINRQDLIVGGSGDESIVKTGMKVPCSAPDHDYTDPIPYIPVKMNSPMFNSEKEQSSDIIMLYYRGLKKFKKSSLQYQDMIPVSVHGFSLNANHQNSICDKYIKRWRQIVSMSKTLKYKMYLPVVKAIELIQLLNPQDCSTETQKRWIIVNNIKSMPKKISLQIDNNDGMLLCEIEAARPD